MNFISRRKFIGNHKSLYFGRGLLPLTRDHWYVLCLLTFLTTSPNYLLQAKAFMALVELFPVKCSLPSILILSRLQIDSMIRKWFKLCIIFPQTQLANRTSFCISTKSQLHWRHFRRVWRESLSYEAVGIVIFSKKFKLKRQDFIIVLLKVYGWEVWGAWETKQVIKINLK